MAGSGKADRLVPGLAMHAIVEDVAELRRELDEALSDADVVLVENLCSLPLNPVASAVVAEDTPGTAEQSCAITTSPGSGPI